MPLRTGLITDNCLALLLLFSLFPSPPTPPSLNGFMGCGLSNVVAKCYFLFYWNDSSLCVVVEVRSTFMKFALWLISRSVEVSFSLCLFASVGGWNKLHKFAWTTLFWRKLDLEMMSSESAHESSPDFLPLCTAVLSLCRGCKSVCMKLIEALRFWTTEGSGLPVAFPYLPRPVGWHLANAFLPLPSFPSGSGFAFVRLHWRLFVPGPWIASGVRTFLLLVESWLFRLNAEAALGQT